jgi:hypothetical protein
VNVGEVATPDPFVVAVFIPPANVPLAPVAGGVKVTVTPPTGLLPPSTTVATNGAPKAVLMVVLCGVPLVGVIFDGGPVVFVSTKFAGDVPPGTVALTV